MKYFDYLSEAEKQDIFHLQPPSFPRDADKSVMAYALGATLYMPAIRVNWAEEILSRKNKGLISVVICLEDAIDDGDVGRAERLVTWHLRQIQEAVQEGAVDYDDLPFLFIRVRDQGQLPRMARFLGDSLSILNGFVFPKFSSRNGEAYFRELEKINELGPKTFYAMPILETPDVIHWETRKSALNSITKIIDRYNDLTLNIRIGATDFSSIFGIRRGCDVTVYDIHVIRDCLTDIINTFCRVERDCVVSAPVWEYFAGGDRVLKPLLRSTPFRKQYGEVGQQIRSRLLNQYLDGLIHETLLDKANGLLGKTVIHPSHIIPVQSMYAVNYEEYMDALGIVENNGKTGVFKSAFQNKMNEVKPHMNWARRILKRASIYGVLKAHQEFIHLLR